MPPSGIRSVLALILALSVAPLHGGTLVINEFVASNHGGLVGLFGNTPDWIELHNPGEEPVELTGWGLSDDEDNPRRWVFEGGTIEPGGFFLVLASGRDRHDIIPPHTNFSISSSGEPLLLTDPHHEIVDFVPATPVPTNISYGRKPDGGGDWYYFKEPTPGEPNTTQAYGELLSPPAFSHEGGFYSEAFELTIETDDPDAIIVYTLDGSLPRRDNIEGTSYQYKQQYRQSASDTDGELLTQTFRSQLYAGGPIPIVDRSEEPDRLTGINTTWQRTYDHIAPAEPVFKGTTVRARAEKEGAIPSEEVTHTYFVTPEGRERYSLPVISLTIQENHLFDYQNGIHVAGVDFDNWRDRFPYTPTSHMSPANYHRRGIEWESPGFLEYFETGDATPAIRQGLGFRIHGGSSRVQPLKSFRVYARRAYDDTNVIDYPLLPKLRNSVDGRPITEFRRLLLRNSGGDYWRTMIRDAFQHRLIQDLGFDYQEYSPAITFVNGEFWGILNIRERIDRHYLARRHQIDPDDIAILTNNAILKDGRPQDRAAFVNLRARIRDYDMSNPQEFEWAAERMDMVNFIRYNIAKIYLKNTDWPGNNIDFWRKITPDRSGDAPKTHDGRWRWIFYDMDEGFGDAQGRDHTHDTLSFATKPGGPSWPNPDWSTTKLRNLLENEWFRNRFVNELADQINSIYNPVYHEPVLDEMYGRILPYVPAQRERWRGSSVRDTGFMKHFGRERPQWMQLHTVNYFALQGTSEITLDTPQPVRGRVRINSLTIEPQLPGVPDPRRPYPWTGTYFQGIPVEIEAIPKAGFRFSHWEGNLAGEDAEVTIEPPEELSATAVFLPDPDYPADEVRPQPHLLREEPYELHSWPRTAEAGTFPDAMVFHQTPVPDPILTDPGEELWTHPYDLEERSRVTGLHTLGVGFINTTNPQKDGGGYVTGAELALDTRGLSSASLRFTAGTVLPNDRMYALRLRYRIGPEGPFRDLLDQDNNPIEYVRNEEAGHEEEFGPIEVPEKLLGLHHLSLKWKYYYIETGVTGPRAKMSLGNIRVEGEPLPPEPTWVFH